jgi:hypothetical protein
MKRLRLVGVWVGGNIPQGSYFGFQEKMAIPRQIMLALNQAYFSSQNDMT